MCMYMCTLPHKRRLAPFLLVLSSRLFRMWPDGQLSSKAKHALNDSSKTYVCGAQMCGAKSSCIPLAPRQRPRMTTSPRPCSAQRADPA